MKKQELHLLEIPGIRDCMDFFFFAQKDKHFFKTELIGNRDKAARVHIRNPDQN